MVSVQHAPVRVLIAGRSAAWSAGVAALLQDPPACIEIAACPEEAAAGLAAADHDLVVIDRALARALAGAGAAAVIEALRGGTADGEGAALSALAESARRRDAAESVLTDQERVVLRLMRRHMTYKEIARELGVSWHTVRTHAQSILRKRGVHSRRDLEQEVATG
jgi:DNA-binding NarL/FixJ family response regulator